MCARVKYHVWDRLLTIVDNVILLSKVYLIGVTFQMLKM